MSNVEFGEEQIYNQNLTNNSMSKNESGLSGWLVKHHLVKDHKQANIILLIIALILLGFSINIIIKLYNSNKYSRYDVPSEILERLPDDVRQRIIDQNAKYK